MDKSSIIKGNWQTRNVTIDGKILSPLKSQEAWNHSPDGFNWGNYGGSGPAQLALALLLEILSEEEAVRYHQSFKFDIVASLPSSNFEIKASEIYNWIDSNVERLIMKEIKEGMISKGGVNSYPTTSPPPPPKGQGGKIMRLNQEHIEIMKHTIKNGMYCGEGEEMDELCEADLMECAGRKSFVPEAYYRITVEGKEALALKD